MDWSSHFYNSLYCWQVNPTIQKMVMMSGLSRLQTKQVLSTYLFGMKLVTKFRLAISVGWQKGEEINEYFNNKSQIFYQYKEEMVFTGLISHTEEKWCLVQIFVAVTLMYGKDVSHCILVKEEISIKLASEWFNFSAIYIL